MKMLNEICENIKTAIVHGRTDIIRSILDTCKFLNPSLLFFSGKCQLNDLIEEHEKKKSFPA